VLEELNLSGRAKSDLNDTSDLPEECESMKYEMFSATDMYDISRSSFGDCLSKQYRSHSEKFDAAKLSSSSGGVF
jgi:hypothetical protein